MASSASHSKKPHKQHQTRESETESSPSTESIMTWRDPALLDTKIRPNDPTPIRGVLPQPLKLREPPQANKISPVDESQLEEETNTLGEESDEIGMLLGTFAPGTFVELRRNNITMEGIVLTEIIDHSTWKVGTLTSQGSVTYHLRTDVHFAVPNVLSADLAARCGVERYHVDPIQQNARLEALKKIRILSIQAEQAAEGSRMWDRQKPANFYDQVKSNDPTKWAEITLSEATKLLYIEPGFINYYATHKYLMDRPLRYLASTGHLQTQTFHVRPQRDVEEIKKVDEWIRDYRLYHSSGPFPHFIEKAKKASQQYDARPKSKSGPMSQEKSTIEWNESDQVFLRFLLRSLQPHRSNQLDPYEMGRYAIVKAILPNVPEIKDSLVHETVVKLGIIAPWQDLYALSRITNPHGNLDVSSPVEKEKTEIFQRTLASKPTAGAVLGPFDFHPYDPLESVRHDFGDATVFVIDDAGAHELDDGISLERIPSEPENYWVHVHVADPARHLHPGHALSQMARKQSSSIYLVSGAFPLFPKALMHDPKLSMSLTDSSTAKEPNRVLTFSVKLDSTGHILGYKLRAGILRNVRTTTYNDVDIALGTPIPKIRYPLGGSNVHQRGHPLSKSQVDDLRILQKLAEVQVQVRLQKNLELFLPDQPTPSLKFKTSPPAELQSPCLRGAKFCGFPEIEYTVVQNADTDQGARRLVSEMMVLAGRVASRVATDHNIPVIRRAMNPAAFGPETDLQALLSLRNSSGRLSYQAYVKSGAETSVSGHYTMLPDRHAFLAIPGGEGYCRSTSPLRRYLDLVIHWQLHHALLGANAPRRLPFDSADLEKLMISTAIQDTVARKTHRASHYFYAAMCIDRHRDLASVGGELPENDPLMSINGWVLRQPRKTLQSSKMAIIQLPEFGLRAHLENPPMDFEHMPPGSDLRVKFKSVNLGIRTTAVNVQLI